jgi:hypothetical protein
MDDETTFIFLMVDDDFFSFWDLVKNNKYSKSRKKNSE